MPATPEVLAKLLERKPVLWLGAGLSIAAGYRQALVFRLEKRLAREP